MVPDANPLARTTGRDNGTPPTLNQLPPPRRYFNNSGHARLGKRGAVRRDKQIEPIRIQARDQFLFGEKVNCETGERLLQNVASDPATPYFGKPRSQNTATLGGAAVLPITTRGRALATAALPIVLRNFRLDPDVDTDGTL